MCFVTDKYGERNQHSSVNCVRGIEIRRARKMREADWRRWREGWEVAVSGIAIL